MHNPGLLIFGLLLGLVGGQALLGEEVAAHPPARPPLNVVFVLADDLGWGELGCYGQTKIPTPYLDRLASEGMRFTQHYSGAPVCAPARCVLLTGRHLGHAEIRGNRQAQRHFPEFSEGQYPLSATALTIAHRFQQAGYRTGGIGKWGLGPVGSTGAPDRMGFEFFFGYNCQAVAHSFYPPYLWRNQEKISINPHPIPGHARRPTGELALEEWQSENYAPYRMIEQAEHFIADSDPRPFFLYLPLIEPHVALHPPAETLEKFPRDWDQRVYRGGNGYLPHPRPRAAYAALIHDLDRHVGRVLEALERAGLTERTLVIFTSDNGPTHPGTEDPDFHIGGVDARFFNSTGGLRGYKGSVYEGGLRVPLIVRQPGLVPAGTVNSSPGYFADWFPTLVEACGLVPAENPDGVSLWPLLTGQETTLSHRPPMIWIFPEYGGQAAVRWDQWKLVGRQLKTPQPDPWELYDLEQDPQETLNLAERHPEWVTEGQRMLWEANRDNPIFPVKFPQLP
jgi:arylsulfatase A